LDIGNPRVHVEIAASLLEAVVTVGAASGDSAHRRESEDFEAIVSAALAEAGVVHGIDQRVVRLVAEGLANVNFELDRTAIATASPPAAGESGTLELAFDMSVLPGLDRGDGTIDHRERRFLHPVSEGTVLALYRPATAGTRGRGVDGTILDAIPPDDPMPVIGPGVRMDEHGRVLAISAGIVRWDGATGFEVVAEYRHDGDVDLRSGNLAMEGDIKISGSVNNGFVVRASGSVEISGDVDGGTVIAGGDVVVRGGILGSNGLVSAQGDVTCKRVQNATIRARGRIRSKIDVIDATISASEIEVVGVVRGGATEAEISLSVGDAGGDTVGASLEAGVPAEWPADAVHSGSRLGESASRHRRNSGGGRRSRGASARREVGTFHAVSAIREAQLRSRQRAALPMAHIDVLGVAQSGVFVRLGDYGSTLGRAIKHSTFKFDHDSSEWIIEDLP